MKKGCNLAPKMHILRDLAPQQGRKIVPIVPYKNYYFVGCPESDSWHCIWGQMIVSVCIIAPGWIIITNETDVSDEIYNNQATLCCCSALKPTK